LREYLKVAPVRSGYPRPWDAHDWLGRLYENRGKTEAALTEYEAALKLEPRDKSANEALRRLKKA
jgi:Flp pilus assembly protein TadD